MEAKAAGKDVTAMSLEDLEAMNRELEERAASSVAAAEQALRAVQLKEQDVHKNAEKLVQLAARKATQSEAASLHSRRPSSRGKENEKENLSETGMESKVESKARHTSSASGSRRRDSDTHAASGEDQTTKKSTPSSRTSAPSRIPRPTSVNRSAATNSHASPPSQSTPQQQQGATLSSFPSDFDLPSRPDAQARLYKARMKALEADLQAQETLLSQRTKELNQKDVIVKQLKASQAKLEKENRAMRATLNKYQRNNEKIGAELTEKEKLLEEATRHGDKASRDKVKMENDMRSREVRMQRAIEEIDRYKSMVEEMKSLEKDRRYVNREEHLKVVQEKTKLEKQKNELLSVFKKQSKLVDVLKRQKVHLEAATALKFTEDEFLKTLEINAP